MNKLLLAFVIALIFLISSLRIRFLSAAAATQTANWTIGWQDTSTNETSFSIEGCLGANCTTFSVLGAVPANTTSFVFVDKADPGLTVRGFRVQAVNADGKSAYSTVVYATSPRIVLPPDGVPAGVTITITVTVP